MEFYFFIVIFRVPLNFQVFLLNVQVLSLGFRRVSHSISQGFSRLPAPSAVPYITDRGTDPYHTPYQMVPSIPPEQQPWTTPDLNESWSSSNSDLSQSLNCYRHHDSLDQKPPVPAASLAGYSGRHLDKISSFFHLPKHLYFSRQNLHKSNPTGSANSHRLRRLSDSNGFRNLLIFS